MKKTIISFVAAFFAVISVAYGQTTSEPLPTTEPTQAKILVVDADVTLVLVNNEKAALTVTGSKKLPQLVTFTRKGDTLVVGSLKKRIMKGAGVIYIPASRLETIHINSGAHVSSLYALQTPNLDIFVNGACTFNIVNIGKTNVIGNDAYSVDQYVQVHEIPADVVRQ
jgi:hypothetical protein